MTISKLSKCAACNKMFTNKNKQYKYCEDCDPDKQGVAGFREMYASTKKELDDFKAAMEDLLKTHMAICGIKHTIRNIGEKQRQLEAELKSEAQHLSQKERELENKLISGKKLFGRNFGQ